MKINELAERLNIGEDTLQEWENVFNIDVPRNESNQRIYSEDDLKLFQAIKSLRDNDNGIETIGRKLSIKKIVPVPPQPSEADENITQTIPRTIENLIRDNQKYVMETLDAKLSPIIDLSHNYSFATYEIGKLQAEKEHLEQKATELNEKIKNLLESTNKDFIGFQRQIEKLTTEKNQEIEKLKSENEALKEIINKKWWGKFS